MEPKKKKQKYSTKTPYAKGQRHLVMGRPAKQKKVKWRGL